ncbi:MAG TPA: hypothetical protein VFI70_09070 [Nitrososphaeraceae archaeon]|nr:hypothetical protein [Nitrososphaeraceae archaeon]
MGSSNKSGSNPYATLTLTPNHIAAGGPIPQNYTLAQQEQKCVAKEGNNGGPWYHIPVTVFAIAHR